LGGHLSPDAILQVLLRLVTLVLSVTVHEFAHAFAADKLGDDLPARQGRLTLNPIAHVDPVGTLLIPAMALFLPIPLFGWGRPVETNPIAYTRRFSMRGGSAMVSFAGPFSNLVLAIVCAFLWIGLARLGVLGSASPFWMLLERMVQLNIVLFLFNLIPVPPLDGSKIIAWIFGYKVDKLLDAISDLGVVALYAAVLISGSAIAWAADLAFDTIVIGLSRLLS
jgi:Zn-dependent protease